MGTSFTNYLVLDCPAQPVAAQITGWMAAKGFERIAARPCFDEEGERERGVFLATMGAHTAVLFSHPHREGDRLLFELHKLDCRILKVWVYDSDVWGYDLFEQREQIAAFMSNPGYFGGPAEPALPRNGDPELLCRAFGIPGREAELTRIQGKRAVFHETVLAQFCESLGVKAAGLDYGVLRGLRAAWNEPWEAEGCRIEWLYFSETGSSWVQRVTPLHEVELEIVPGGPPPGPFWLPPVTPDLPPGMRPLIFFSWLLSLILRPVIWLFSIGFRGVAALQRVPLFRMALERRLTAATNPLYAALQRRATPTVIRDGNRLVNELHRCQIHLPAGMEPADGAGGATLFHVLDGDRQLLWRAHRPDALTAFANLPAGAEVIDDRRFFVSGLPARTLRFRFTLQDQQVERWTNVIQTRDALYFLMVDGNRKKPLDTAFVERLEALVESFELLS